MHRVRVRVTSPNLSSLPSVVVESPQAARSLGNGATVTWDLVAGRARAHNRIEVVFSFGSHSRAERAEIVRDFLENTLHIEARRRDDAGKEVRSYGVVLSESIQSG